MKKLKKADFFILAVILLIIAAIVFFTVRRPGKDPAPAVIENTSGTPREVKYSDYDGKKIGILTGTSFEDPTLKYFPNADYLYYNSTTDITQALREGMIDGFVNDEPLLRILNSQQHDIDYIREKLNTENYAFGFTKNDARVDKIRNEFNEFLKGIKADGTLKELNEIWFGDDESKKVVDFSGLSGKKLNVVTTALDEPFSYYKENQIVGMAIKLVELFCRQYGYEPHIENVDYSARVPGLVSNRYDMCAGPFTVTEERKESINFSDVVYEGGICLAVRADDLKGTLNSGAVTEKKVTYSDYNGKKIGIVTGTNFEPPTFKFFPDSEYLYFNGNTDITEALRSKKIDGFIHDEPVLRVLSSEQSDISYIKEKLADDDYAFGFTKNDERVDGIRNEFNEFLKTIKADGTLKEMNDIWFGDDESKKVVDLTGFSGKELNVVTTALEVPFTYYKDNKLVGLTIDLVEKFCRKYGYVPNIENVDYSARVPGLVSNRYDMCAGAFTITEERKESINFSDVIYEGGICLAVRAEDLARETAGVDVSQIYKDFDGKNFGIQMSSSFEAPTLEKFPNSKYQYYESAGDLTIALQQGKIDAFIYDEPIARSIAHEQSDVDYVREPLIGDDYCYGFPKTGEKTQTLITQFNEFVKKLRASGELEAIAAKWIEGEKSEHTLDESGMTGENGTLNVSVISDLAPFSYYEDNKLAGICVDLTLRFGKEYGYKINFEATSVAGIIAGVSSGLYDIGASILSPTEERKETMSFSDTFYKGGLSLIARKADLAAYMSTSSDTDDNEEEGFFEGIANSFHRNFIREDRWKLILEGIGTTCAITALTVLFGTILAFLICMFRRIDSILANKICNLYVKLLQGTPILVLLMILYYVVFGKSGLEAIWVAVIGFSLNLGAFGSEIMRSGIEGVDPGQREAALALGYTENQAFFKFIFPQASLRFLPVYRGEIISLLKNTSIVGYIAIQDLTKMSDIIRSRTFEAFFPLIVTAVIYFILAWIISMILARLLKLIDPRRKKKGVKGVAVK